MLFRSTKLVNTAFNEIKTLPEIEQNIFAQNIIDEIRSEKKWDESFANSEDFLSSMANEALDEFNLKNTQELDISKL